MHCTEHCSVLFVVLKELPILLLKAADYRWPKRFFVFGAWAAILCVQLCTKGMHVQIINNDTELLLVIAHLVWDRQKESFQKKTFEG